MSKQPIADNNHAHPFYEIKFSKRICDMSKCPSTPPPTPLLPSICLCVHLPSHNSTGMSVWRAMGLYMTDWLTGLADQPVGSRWTLWNEYFYWIFSNEFLLPQPYPPSPVTTCLTPHDFSLSPLNPKKMRLSMFSIAENYCKTFLLL